MYIHTYNLNMYIHPKEDPHLKETRHTSQRKCGPRGPPLPHIYIYIYIYILNKFLITRHI